MTSTPLDGSRVSRRAIHILLIGWGIVSALPLLWMLSASVQTTEQIYGGLSLIPKSFEWSNYTRAWREARVGTYFLNSSTVQNDNAADLLVGGGGRDLFIRSFGDWVLVRSGGEVIVTV